jgi:exosortase D (VPLPA-CTERM-specific)
MQLRLSKPTYVLLAFAFASIAVSFAPALSRLYDTWSLQPEYSYGILIPALSLFLIWRQREQLRGLRITGSWYGLALVAAGLALRVVGELSTMSTLQRYAFLLVLYGVLLALTGPVIFRRLWMPLAILIFMVPLPMFLTDGLSLDLQLVSSALGVWVIRAVGISVYLEGNVVDLGTYKLEVAEACSGLRYLFPLLTLSFLVAYVFRGPMWKRAVIFLSSVPITILMNSLRIGVIGITVDRWGTRMAEGLLHEFEGWAVFMFSVAAVLLIARGLAKMGGSKRSEAALNTGPAPQAAGMSTTDKAAATTQRDLPALQRVPWPFAAATILVTAGALVDLALPARQAEVPPARAGFEEFPAQIGEWAGQRGSLEPVYLDALRLDDYLLADYQDGDGLPLNFYVAYYQSQRSNHRVHSPIQCIPGGGWTIRNLERRSLQVAGQTRPLPVNRLVISLGGQQALVYYWFQERGRMLTDENVVKWYIFWDALTRNRTDGALVRLVVPIKRGAQEADLDAKMQRFLALVEPRLNQYVPD